MTAVIGGKTGVRKGMRKYREFIPGSPDLSKLFQKKEIVIINSMIDYTKSFVPVADIERNG